ncbi:uncharacterized protein LOC117105627 [Anneissia japonica]|uniref:uncharacterized protein LOC117105627 n=1 Tax=Anneissia japonica TaxID=1529436 RepID=UPI00142556DE|nr:uncharacterized protein LOC117105627 [Anneissia japonica]
MVQREVKGPVGDAVDHTTKKRDKTYEYTYRPSLKETVAENNREILQRKSASNRERSRMRDMNDAFDMLRNKLNHRLQPPGKRISKIQALRCAIEYIADLEETLSSASPTQGNCSAYYHWARTRGFIWAREKAMMREDVGVDTTIDSASACEGTHDTEFETQQCFYNN